MRLINLLGSAFLTNACGFKPALSSSIEMEIKAEFEFEDAEDIVRTIYESVKEERDEGTDKPRSYLNLALNGNVLSVYMCGEDITRL